MLDIRRTLTLILIGTLSALSPLLSQTPIGTSFTYQGLLEFEGEPASGSFDLKFRLYDGPDPNSAFLLGTDTHCALPIVQGLMAAELEFGNVFSAGEKLWLEISAFPAGDCTTFTNLSPLQALTGAPFAHFAPENDPTVTESVKDGVSWDEVGSIPAGFIDGVDDTIGTEEITCYSTDWGDPSRVL